MLKQTLSCILLLITTPLSAHAMPAFIGADYSGEYSCKGKNDSVGDYEVLVNLTLNTETSHDIYGVYDFNTETNNQATYVGQILAKGRQFAMTFKLLGSSTSSYSTGMGEFKKIGHKRWRFHTTYYEPDGNGGNFGSDSCTTKTLGTSSSKSSKKRQKSNKAAS